MSLEAELAEAEAMLRADLDDAEWRGFWRGLVLALAMSVPLWAALIAAVWGVADPAAIA